MCIRDSARDKGWLGTGHRKSAPLASHSLLVREPVLDQWPCVGEDVRRLAERATFSGDSRGDKRVSRLFPVITDDARPPLLGSNSTCLVSRITGQVVHPHSHPQTVSGQVRNDCRYESLVRATPCSAKWAVVRFLSDGVSCFLDHPAPAPKIAIQHDISTIP